MSYTEYTYLILCEDKHQYYFAQSYLRHKGVASRKIRSYTDLPLPNGDAKKFVETEFNRAIQKVRKNENDILIIFRDADMESYDDVTKKFDVSGVFPAIPKRNIETWFYFLDNPNSADSLNESTDRKGEYPKTGTRPTSYGKKLEPVLNDIRQNKETKPSNIPNSLYRTAFQLIACERANHRP
jgi:hypothetical protein